MGELVANLIVLSGSFLAVFVATLVVTLFMMWRICKNEGEESGT